MIKRIKRSGNLSELAFKEIRNYITENKLKVGDKLPSEAKLTYQLGCSKSAVREALKSSEALGIIKVVHGKGAIINRFNFDVIFQNLPYHLQVNKHDLEELLEIREAFEVYFLDKVIDKISSQTISRLQKLVAKMETMAEKGELRDEEDIEFHRLLCESSDNTAALKLLRVFWSFLSKASYVPGYKMDPVVTAKEHREILNAVEEHDVGRAKEAMKNHFSELKERLRDNVKKKRR